MNNDELPGGGNHEVPRAHRDRMNRLTEPGKLDDERARDLERVVDAGRRRDAEEDRLLRDEDEVRSELPR